MASRSTSGRRDRTSGSESSKGLDEHDLDLPPSLEEVVTGIRTLLTVSEVAVATGVKDRQVHHWAAGRHFPQAETRDRLFALYAITGRLRTALGIDRAKVWLFTSQSHLSDDRPFDRLATGDFNSVLTATGDLWRQGSPGTNHLDADPLGLGSAYERIVRRYYSLVHAWAATLGQAPEEVHELVQEGLVGVFRAVRDFRPDGALNFDAFARVSIEDAIKDAARRRGLHVPEDADGSLEAIPLSGSEAWTAGLSGVEERVLRSWKPGRTSEQVADELGVEAQVVENALRGIAEKMARHLA